MLGKNVVEKGKLTQYSHITDSLNKMKYNVSLTHNEYISQKYNMCPATEKRTSTNFITTCNLIVMCYFLIYIFPCANNVKWLSNSTILEYNFVKYST